ncbi:MAG: type IV pilus assembly protein PilM [Candidatus Omnitrophota bacterium]
MSISGKHLFLGVDIGASAVKICLLSKEPGGRLKLLKAVCEEYGSSSDTLPQYQPAMLGYILKKFLSKEKVLKNIKTGISIAGQAAFVRLVDIPVTAPKKLRQIVLYETQQQIPFPIKDVVWDFQICGKDNNQLSVLLAAVKKELITSILDITEECGLDVEFVDVSNLSVYNSVQYFSRNLQNTLILDCGAKTTNIIVVDSQKIWTRSLPIGGEDITEAIASSLNMDRITAERIKKEKGKILMLYYGKENYESEEEGKIAETITNVLTDLTNEIVNTLNFYRSQADSPMDFRKVLLTGGVSKLENIDKFFENSLSIPAEKVDFFSVLNVHPDVDVQKNEFLGGAIGAALRGMGRSAVNINLLPQEQLRINRFAKKKPFIIASVVFLLLILVSSNIFIFKKYFLNRRYFDKVELAVTQYQRNEKNQEQIQAEISGYNKRVEDMSRAFVNKYSAVNTIESLAQAMPDSIWIKSLTANWEKDSLELHGYCEGPLVEIGTFQESLKQKDNILDASIVTVGKEEAGKIGFSMRVSLRK